MPKQSQLLLLALLLTLQLACVRSGSRGESHSNASVANDPARIDEILRRYEEVVGGKEAIAAITSYKIRGTFQLAGMQGKMEGWGKDPKKTLTVIEFPRLGTL